MPRVLIKNLKNRINNHSIGHISNAPKRSLKESELPFKITLVDIDTKEEALAQILSYVPIKNFIPEMFALLSENKMPEECKTDVLVRCEVQTVDELAFYVYNKV